MAHDSPPLEVFASEVGPCSMSPHDNELRLTKKRYWTVARLQDLNLTFLYVTRASDQALNIDVLGVRRDPIHPVYSCPTH